MVSGSALGHETEAVLEAEQPPPTTLTRSMLFFWLIGDDLRDALGRALGDGDRCGHDMRPFDVSAAVYPKSLLASHVIAKANL